ncbi:MAG TPA: hypothetical protein VE780_02585 [Thermoleophilaceae bacterium]|nr:hypothetical protein [Thermoleophilaceae bacterium]
MEEERGRHPSGRPDAELEEAFRRAAAEQEGARAHARRRHGHPRGGRGQEARRRLERAEQDA